MPAHSPVSDFEAMVLLAVIRAGDDAYGVPIGRDLERATGRTIALAAVYAALQRLERRGFVASRKTEPTPVRGGRAKRVFHVTAEGLAAARELARTFRQLWKGIPQLA
jgi:PadR family transcriptional regulator, regulatory protein PadR